MIWTFYGLLRGNASTRWPWAKKGAGQDGVLGMPEAHRDRCEDGCRACADVCPTKAITVTSDSIDVDYGRCVACQLCVEACPTGAMQATEHWAFGVRGRDDLIDRANVTNLPAKQKRRKTFPPRYRRSLHVRHVDSGSCNGCESELQSLNNPFYNLHRLGIFFTPSPRFADVLLVTGPVTYAMASPLRRTYEAMPDPKWVIATGTCAVSGGVAAGGYACGDGAGDVLPVDIYVPGCPPNPAAIIEALLLLQERISQRVEGGRYVK
jgi:Ni,Fe-hydrogenase III small subunit/Pyruvate/2-oxoacid:ferredoxin oxidoreductase delta subunit